MEYQTNHIDFIMASNLKKLLGTGYNKYSHLLYQKKLIEQKYDFLKCDVKNKVLTCVGYISPDYCMNTYKIKIEYVAGHEPKSTILVPDIEPSTEIHMYKDHSVCLHYPPDMKWTIHKEVANYTIPWLCEWIIFYELYLINGNIWKGRESPSHIKECEKNINQDYD